MQLDVIYDATQLSNSAVSNVGVSLYFGSNTGSQRVGSTAATQLAPWNAGDGTEKITIDEPLSAFDPDGGGHIGDVEADNTGLYQMQIGLNGVQDPGSPAVKVYFDNLKLVQVAQPTFLKLNVNRTTGTVSISNPTAVSINLSHYEITSAAGGLVKANWTGYEGSAQSTPDGVGWDASGGSSATALSESKLLFGGNTESTLAAGGSVSLGNIYNTALNTKDLVFQYANSARPNKLLGAPPNSPAGDYNNDGIVDAADYTIWRANLGKTQATDGFTLTNEDPGSTPGTVSIEDYNYWKAHFGASGTGAGQIDYLVSYTPPGSGAGSSSAVPEPSSVVLSVLALLGTMGFMHRRG